MADILLDTDVFIDHLRGARVITPGEDSIHYSVVTRAELYAGNASEERQVATLLAPFRELEVDRAIAERAGSLRRRIGIPMPDALIAATALLHSCILVTRNVRDFKGVAELPLRDPSTRT